jgi:ADP-ribosyl-[dinitrogen reductase] hydrolase
MKSHKTIKSKFIGCMLGVAIGDALGKQNEGLTRSDILRCSLITDYGKAKAGCPGDKLEAGQYTDDTEQMLVLARSLIECRGFDPADFSKRLAKWGKDAMSDPIRKSFVGPSSSVSISRLNSGMSWQDSGSDIPSCGSAMRVAPIGLFYKDLDEVEKYAALSSIPTHNNNEAIAGAVAVAVGVRCALMDMDCAAIINETCAKASKYNGMVAEKIEEAFRKKDDEPDKVLEAIGTSYLVNETVPCAFYCFSRYFEQPEKAIIEAVNAGGDTDSIACITGALCGARHGVEAFPERWIEGLENKEYVIDNAGMIFKRAVKV